MKIFIVSRTAIPIDFSIDTNISPMCSLSETMLLISLDDVVHFDGQVQYVHTYFLLSLEEKVIHGSISTHLQSEIY